MTDINIIRLNIEKTFIMSRIPLPSEFYNFTDIKKLILSATDQVLANGKIRIYSDFTEMLNSKEIRDILDSETLEECFTKLEPLRKKYS